MGASPPLPVMAVFDRLYRFLVALFRMIVVSFICNKGSYYRMNFKLFLLVKVIGGNIAKHPV